MAEIQGIQCIALVAHDNCKAALVQWVKRHMDLLRDRHLVCTGTTGRLVHKAFEDTLGEAATSVTMDILKSGPLGGDQQLGARIAEGKIDMLIFFWDPMQAQPHDVDVKALLRIASLYDIPAACNAMTADFLIASPLFLNPPQASPCDFSSYTERPL